jgi:hypothetical protein
LINRIDDYCCEILQIANNDKHGYSQKNRWGSPDYDCSSLVISVVNNSGIPVKKHGATYTGNMKQAFLKAGFKDVTDYVDLTNGNGLNKGDILLKSGSHTEIYIGCGLIVGATIDERGDIVGLKEGDQTGEEIRCRNYYNRPWGSVLRYK